MASHPGRHVFGSCHHLVQLALHLHSESLNPAVVVFHVVLEGLHIRLQLLVEGTAVDGAKQSEALPRQVVLLHVDGLQVLRMSN